MYVKLSYQKTVLVCYLSHIKMSKLHLNSTHDILAFTRNVIFQHSCSQTLFQWEHTWYYHKLAIHDTLWGTTQETFLAPWRSPFLPSLKKILREGQGKGSFIVITSQILLQWLQILANHWPLSCLYHSRNECVVPYLHRDYSSKACNTTLI